MSSVALIFILLLALSIPACNARHLRMNAKNLEYFNKGFEKVILDETDPVQGKPVRAALLKGVAVDQIRDNVEKAKGTVNPTEDLKGKKEAASGREVLMPSFHAGLLEKTKSEARLEKRMRSLLGNEFNEEHLGSNETGVFTNLVAMDYPRAQRGPSIHNK